MGAARGFMAALVDGLKTGFDRGRIDDEAGLADFVASRAAHVAQTALFGYLTERMGTRAREIFQDPAFQDPLTTAQASVFRDCAADLTVFVAGLVHDAGLPPDRSAALAIRLYRAALQAQGQGPQDTDEARFHAQDWARATDGETAFSHSPEGVIRAAPVIDGFKQLDREIVLNSVRFRWVDVRRQARDRIDAAALAAAMA